MSSGHRAAQQSGHKRFSLGNSNKVSTVRFLALHAVSLSLLLAGMSSFVRLWRPILLAGTMITGVVLTEVIARPVGRSRPPAGIMMLGADATSSFPSGHVVGASNFLLVGAYLVFSRSSSRTAVIGAFGAAALGLTVEAASRVYLGYHWFTDTVASACLSIALLVVVILLDVSRGEPPRPERTA